MAPAQPAWIARMGGSNNTHYTQGLEIADPEMAAILTGERERQRTHVALIASENNQSESSRQAEALSWLSNKYSEGYPNARFYEGNEFADKVETLAINRAKELFHCAYANVQPNSGSQTNQAVYLALLKPGDTIMGMALASGGHLTHGAFPSSSGNKYGIYKTKQYNVDKDTGLIDYDAVEKMALETKPKIIVTGGSAYARAINFRKFREIADKAGAYLLVDMAHFAGLVAGDAYKPAELKADEKPEDFNPIKWAHVVTTTTHKTLRGPRGGLILSDVPDLVVQKAQPAVKGEGGAKDTPAKSEIKLGAAIDSAVFPGLQGGPMMHTIAGKAVAFGEMIAQGKDYAQKVVENAQELSAALKDSGLKLVTDGTDTHLVLIDFRDKLVPGKTRLDKASGQQVSDHLSGKEVAAALDRAGLTANMNAVPGDPRPPTEPSGLRVGTPAGTTRGFGREEFRQIGTWIGEVVNQMAQGKDTAELEGRIRGEVTEMLAKFPMYDEPSRGRLDPGTPRGAGPHG